MGLIYAMSDIHGYLNEFEKSLSLIDLDNKDNKLVLLGDYIDYGYDSKGVLERIKKLEEDYPNQVITLLGNHDEYFIKSLYSNDAYDSIMYYIENFSVIKEFVELDELDPEMITAGYLNQLTKVIRTKLIEHDVVKWYMNKYDEDRYYETDKQIFVHAGLDEDLADFRETDPHTLVTKYPAQIGHYYKDIISGHISSATASDDYSYLGTIYHDGYSHYYIDGKVKVSGVIPVLVYDTKNNEYIDCL